MLALGYFFLNSFPHVFPTIAAFRSPIFFTNSNFLYSSRSRNKNNNSQIKTILIPLVCSDYLSCDFSNKSYCHITPAALVTYYLLMQLVLVVLLLLTSFYWNRRQTCMLLESSDWVLDLFEEPSRPFGVLCTTLNIQFIKAKGQKDIHVSLFVVSAFQQFVGLLTKRGLKWLIL